MRDHPLTPMRESNLVRVLQRQTRHNVELIPRETVAAGGETLQAAVDAVEGIAIIDAINDDDLHRIGKKYPNKWHFDHMLDPTITSPGSIMPPYPWLIEQTLDASTTKAKLNAMRLLGVPYTDEDINNAEADLQQQAETIAADLNAQGVSTRPDREIVALIAYLQRLGTDINNAPAATATND